MATIPNVTESSTSAPQRWSIVNAAKSRFFYLDLEGQAFTVIGVDGGLQERSVTSDILLVTPGERVDVIVTPKGKAGTTLTLRVMLYNRGYGSVHGCEESGIHSRRLSVVTACRRVNHYSPDIRIGNTQSPRPPDD